VYSQRNRSASVRIPLYSKSPKAKRLEFRCPDPSCNPYLAFSAMLQAGLDALEADNAFLKVGGVFTDDLIETWISYKRETEIDAVRLRPHPYEFALYYDI